MQPIKQAFESNDLTTFTIACATVVGVLLALALARFVVGRVLLAVSRRTSNRFDDVAARDHQLMIADLAALKAGRDIIAPVYSFIHHGREPGGEPVRACYR